MEIKAKNELLRQKIKSMVEQGGYADIVAPDNAPGSKARWFTADLLLGSALAAFILLTT